MTTATTAMMMIVMMSSSSLLLLQLLTCRWCLSYRSVRGAAVVKSSTEDQDASPPALSSSFAQVRLIPCSACLFSLSACLYSLSICLYSLSACLYSLSACLYSLSVCTLSVCLYSLSACLYSMSACLYSLSACLYSACLYSMSACLYSLSACRPLCLSARPSPYLSFLKLLLVWGCCFSLGLVVRHVLSLLLVLLLFVIFPASSPLADELISCTVLTYTCVLVCLKYMCMCSISRISSSWTRVGCKKTLCLLHYPRKL